MRAKTLEINWHDGQAVYSVDFSSDGSRFASAGADCSVRLWSIKKRSGTSNDDGVRKKGYPKKPAMEALPVHIEFLSELKRHSAPVNVVRFSPTGEYLASAGDDSCVIIWKRSLSKEPSFGKEYSEFEQESWSVVQMFYGHNKEIYDLAWSPCGQYFVTASIDNTARVWSLSQRSVIKVLVDHTHYVQGVAWDPLGEYVATQSSDRSVAIYRCSKDVHGQLHIGNCAKRHYRFSKSKPAPKATNEPAQNSDSSQQPSTPSDSASNGTATTVSYRLYHDENLVTFFRRLSFSPDGAFLLTPSGLCRNVETTAPTTENEEFANCAYLYPRNTILKHPIAYTSHHTKPSIAIRWCGIPYERRPSKKPSMFGMPYRLVYAVASQDAVYIYDTQQAAPLCIVSGMHFAPITDLAWSRDGKILAFSSADGYCSAVVFEEEELGQIKPPSSSLKRTETVDGSDVEMMEIAPPPTSQLKFKSSNFTANKEIPPPPSPVIPQSPPPVLNNGDGDVRPEKRRITPTLVSSSSSTTYATYNQAKKRRIAPVLISAPVTSQAPSSSSHVPSSSAR